MRQREDIKKDHKNQVREIKMENKKREKDLTLPKELHRYKDAKVFSKDARKMFKPGEVMGPVTVGLEDNLLDVDEVAVLKRGPKFCCRRIMCRERFLIDMENVSVRSDGLRETRIQKTKPPKLKKQKRR